MNIRSTILYEFSDTRSLGGPTAGPNFTVTSKGSFIGAKLYQIRARELLFE